MNFDLMIVLATNKSIMRSKLKTALLGNFDLMINIIGQIRPHEQTQFRPHEKWKKIRSHEFDLMKKWISISWNSTSWPWVANICNENFIFLMYSGRRLIGSLWARDNLIPITELDRLIPLSEFLSFSLLHNLNWTFYSYAQYSTVFGFTAALNCPILGSWS